LFYFAREAAGAAGTRLSLRPLFSLGERFMHNPGAFASREGGVVPLKVHASGMDQFREKAYDWRQGALTPRPILFNRREDLMYAAIRQAKAKTGTAEELARRIKEGAIPIISDVEGFMAYYVVYAPDDTVTAISIFNNHAGAEEANRRAIAWIEQNLAPLLAGQATAVAGPVIVHTLA
jgi:hypothetical protein